MAFIYAGSHGISRLSYFAQQAQVHLSPQHVLPFAAAALQQTVLEPAPGHCVVGFSVLAGSANAVKANAVMAANMRMDFITIDCIAAGVDQLHLIRHRSRRNPSKKD